MMSQMAGAMGMPFRRAPRRRPRRARTSRRARRSGRPGPTPPKARNLLFAGGCRAGSQICRRCPKDLNELPPGLADFDLSVSEVPRQAVACCTFAVVDYPTASPSSGGSPMGAAQRAGRRRRNRLGRWVGHSRTGRRALPRRTGPRRTPIEQARSPRPRPNARPVPCCSRDRIAHRHPRLDDHDDLPRIIRAGGIWPARNATGAATPSNSKPAVDLPAALTEQVRRGDGWVKLVGDWIDRSVGIWRRCGPMTCWWPPSPPPMTRAPASRCTCSARDALPGLHRRGYRLHRAWHGADRRHRGDDGRARGTALVPTMINIENFPGFADAANKFPTHATPHARAMPAARNGSPPPARLCAHLRRHRRREQHRPRPHRRRVDALKTIGMTATDALGRRLLGRRHWLGRLLPDRRRAGDLLCFQQDPRTGADVLSRPDRVILRGASTRVDPWRVGLLGFRIRWREWWDGCRYTAAGLISTARTRTVAQLLLGGGCGWKGWYHHQSARSPGAAVGATWGPGSLGGGAGDRVLSRRPSVSVTSDRRRAGDGDQAAVMGPVVEGADQDQVGQFSVGPPSPSAGCGGRRPRVALAGHRAGRVAVFQGFGRRSRLMVRWRAPPGSVGRGVRTRLRRWHHRSDTGVRHR